MLPDCPFKILTRLASGCNCCAKLSPRCAIWPLWPTPTLPSLCWKCARSRLRGARLVSNLSPQKSGIRRTLRPPSQEAPDELVGRERYRAMPRPPVAAVVLVAEAHAALVEADQPAVRDGDPVGVAGEIGEHRLRPGEGRLGVDEPVLLP